MPPIWPDFAASAWMAPPTVAVDSVTARIASPASSADDAPWAEMPRACSAVCERLAGGDVGLVDHARLLARRSSATSPMPSVVCSTARLACWEVVASSAEVAAIERDAFATWPIAWSSSLRIAL